MSKRSFVRDDRFVEVAWTKRAVERVEGQRDTPGVIFDDTFPSEAEVEAHVTELIRALLAAGYTEVDAATPLRIDFAEYVEALARPCATLQLEVSPGESAGSRRGGLPWLAASDTHPRCGVCEQPMQLVVQLALGELAEVLAIGEGLLQVFVCDSACYYAQGWAAFAKSQQVRVIDPNHGAVAAPSTATDDDGNETEVPTLAERTIRFNFAGDYPSRHDLAALLGTDQATAQGLILDAELGSRFEKVGGWPCWAQSDETPTCPTCATRMTHVLQLESALHGATTISGNVLYVVRCARCATFTSLQQH
jgi:hypothetical protein